MNNCNQILQYKQCIGIKYGIKVIQPLENRGILLKGNTEKITN